MRFAEALAGFERLGDRRGAARALNRLGHSYREQGRWPESAGCFLRASRAILADLGDRPWAARTLLSLGKVYVRQGLWNDAIDCLDECFVTFREMDNRVGQADAQSLLDQAFAGRDR